MPKAFQLEITGPDDDGSVWLDAVLESGEQLMLNLGTKEDVAELVSQWLGSIEERDPEWPGEER